jgi:hypothetical protein
MRETNNFIHVCVCHFIKSSTLCALHILWCVCNLFQCINTSLSLSRTHTHCSAALLFVSNKMIFIRSINESCLHSSCAENGALISRANGRETCGRRRQRVKNWPFSMAFNGVYKRAIYWHSTMHGLFFYINFHWVYNVTRMMSSFHNGLLLQWKSTSYLGSKTI